MAFYQPNDPYFSAMPTILNPDCFPPHDPFWETEDFVVFGLSQVVRSTRREVWFDYPDQRERISHMWCAAYQMASGSVVPPPMPPQNPSQAQEYPLQISPDTPMATSGASDNDQATLQDPATFTPTPITSEGFILPPYTPDPSLTSETACRTYTAYPDQAETQFFPIPDDDWREVKAHRIDEFTRKIYEALGHAWSMAPPEEANVSFSSQGFRDKYLGQQKKTAFDLKQKMLKTESQIKAAKAHCQLMVHAVIHVSEVGFLKEHFDERKISLNAGRSVPREHRLDTVSICSVRLEKVVSVVKANKLIAKDILTNSNLNRIAQDPDFYLVDKFKYLASNSVRKTKSEKRKRSASTDNSGLTQHKFGRGSFDGSEQ